MLGLVIVLLSTVVLWDAGTRLGARLLGEATASARLLAGAVLGAAFLLLVLLGLGQFHRIRSDAVLAAAVGFWVFCRWAGAPWSLLHAGRRFLGLLLPRRGDWLAALGFWFVTALCVHGLARGLLRPSPDYDALSYHLPYTAEVLDTRGVPLLDTPFGDSAQAYQPKNDDLLRAAACPTPGDERLAWTGSYPHLPVLLLGVYVLARRLGCGRRAAVWGAATASIAPELITQATSAMVDLAMASWWTAFAALAAQRPSQRSPGSGVGGAWCAGLALGLAYGTKYLAVPLTPLVALALAPAWSGWRGGRVRCLATMAAGTLLTGAYFYARNLLLTGNPLYPIKLEVAGVTLLQGNYGRSVMKDWVFHHAQHPDLPVWTWTLNLTGGLPDAQSMLQWESAWVVLAVPAGLWALGVLASLRRPATLAVLAIAPAVLAICWWLVPYTYARFALLAIAMVGLGAARLGAVRWIGPVVPAALAAHLLLTRTYHVGVISMLGTATVAVVLCWRLRRHVARIALWAAPVFGGGLLVVVAATHRPLWTDFPDERFVTLWRHVETLPEPGAIAYAGNNLPYPLRGRGNRIRRVVYVPTDGRTDLRFHDRALAWRRDGLPPAICPEPGFYRRWQDPSAWLAAMRRLGVRYLVVTRLQDHQLLNIRHDANGFPVEAAWARALSPVFEPVFADEFALVFAVHGDREPRGPLPPKVERREPDAFYLLKRPEDLARWYPLGVREIRSRRYARLRERALR